MRTFIWWFGMGSLLTLAVLMIQGGLRDLIHSPQETSALEAVLSVGTTILGGGILAGSMAVVLNRLR